MAAQKLKWTEKLGYGLGDSAFNFVWMTFIYFQVYFYTDVFGLSAAAVGSLLLLTRIWDTVNDPVMGAIADRTETRWGKFRPYLLFGAIPLGITATLALSTPDLSDSGKLIYAYATYFAVGMLFTAMNIPYASMMSVMTSDPKERASLATWRFAGAFVTGIVVLHFTMDLVGWLGGGDDALGFQRTMAVYSLILVLLMFATVALTKERIRPKAASHSHFIGDLTGIVRSRPFLILFAVAMFSLGYIAIRNAITMHYFKYVLFDEQGAKWFLVGGAIFCLIGALATPWLIRCFDKKYVYIAITIANAVLMALIYFCDGDDLTWIYVIHFASQLLSGPPAPIIFAMYADLVDYQEHKTGIRSSGLVFAGASFSQKMGWAIGGAATGFLLAAFGFEANIQQTESTRHGILMMFTLIPALLALLAAYAMSRYTLTEQRVAQIQSELSESPGSV
ncbi:MFS transporter [Neiella sp. HB171785]|uniref:MFS transporter n=1 Tax=Neiella litorisoli TaxID=2771431 RepID=A0A8J6QTM2_9GAMM|nr:MFS transporter [Neiella litorisoli]MBD1390709.1 MFS transporter [Neiella litorisoli]